MNPTARITLAQEALAKTIATFDDVLKDCTREELLGARAIREVLADAQRRMNVLSERMKNREKARE